MGWQCSATLLLQGITCRVARGALGEVGLTQVAAPQQLQCANPAGPQPFVGVDRTLPVLHAYLDSAPVFDGASSDATPGVLLNFDQSGASTSPRLRLAVPQLLPGEFVAVVLEWGDGERSASGARGDSQLDLCVSDVDANAAASCTGAAGNGAQRVLLIGNPLGASSLSSPRSLAVTIRLAAGMVPGWLRLAVEGEAAHSRITGFSEAAPQTQVKQTEPAVDVELSLTPTTINVGQSATLTWTSTNADTCAASDDWSGNEPLNGTMMVMPATANTYGYTLTCINSDSMSMETQVLTVLTPQSGGGGGLDLWLCGLRRGRTVRAMRRTS